MASSQPNKNAKNTLVDMAIPDRANCPSDEAVRAVAQKEQPMNDSLQAHLDSCPACRREFIDHQAQLEWNHMYKKMSWLLYIVLFLIVCSVIYRSCREQIGHFRSVQKSDSAHSSILF
jgi:CHASE3 domain sensor protein